MLETLKERFQALQPDADFWSLRFQRETSEQLSVRQDILQPVSASEDQGVMLTVVKGDGMGYAATSDLSQAGLERALGEASAWAARTQGKGVVDFSRLPQAGVSGEYATPVEQPWSSLGLSEKVDLLREACQQLKTDDRIVDWQASFWHTDAESHLLTSAGGVISQRLAYLIPDLRATANQGSETQTRTFGRMAGGRQGGLEVLDQGGWRGAASRVAEQALQLLTAPNCPEGTMDVVLAPDQMVLQIHESIGHPLELDRILGDERNYAGTSFVTPDMFGSYQYGSPLLNITFDPTLPNEMASYGFDDDGSRAQREFIIKDGILQRGLGGVTSQLRSELQGVANSRACSWNRPPIDRMANLNLEPGDSTLAQMIGAVERGVYMHTNMSWSIDDSRNKFQFGCEYGQLIEDGELKGVVKNPNYRGISATFWRNLAMVGHRDTFDVMGTPFCGKGEPNQVIRVGHATPTCLFTDVAVFGGA